MVPDKPQKVENFRFTKFGHSLLTPGQPVNISEKQQSKNANFSFSKSSFKVKNQLNLSKKYFYLSKNIKLV